MQLNDVRPSVETSGGMEEELFSIEDQGMIFEILRNKMYSNPILAIAREITCNARDAHREIGTSDIPIHVHIPTSIEPFYKVKDFGPGISPDRMSNVFIKYTASTKRSSNLQTGGFGLGAKTPFSYSDTFTIVTNVEGIKYNYACFIDETRVGKLTLLSQAPTDEPNGTEIIIPVNNQYDFCNFAEATKKSTQHWDVKPIIKGSVIEYKDMKSILEGHGWKIVDASGYYNREVKLIIDSIEYPLGSDAIQGSTNMLNSARGNMFLYFEVGELTLAANREQVYLDDATKAKIKAQFTTMRNEVFQSVKDKLLSMDNLWLANIYYRDHLKKAFNDISFLGPLDWHGYALNGNYGSCQTGCRVFSYKNGDTSYKRASSDPNKIYRSDGRSQIHFSEHSVLFINDLPLQEPTGRHVKKAFEQNPNLKSLQLICPSDTVTEKVLNDKIHLDMMEPRYLSEITSASGKKRKSSARLILLKFQAGSGNFRQVPYNTFEDDCQDKVLCKLKKDEWNANSRSLVMTKNAIYSSLMRDLQRVFNNVSFYAVDVSVTAKRIAESLDDCQLIEEFIQERVIESGIDYLLIKSVGDSFSYEIDNVSKLVETLAKDIENPDSILLKYRAAYTMLKGLSQGDIELLRLYENINGNIDPKEIEKFIKENEYLSIWPFFNELRKTYPLLRHFDLYRHTKVMEEIAHYVNLVDSYNSKEE